MTTTNKSAGAILSILTIAAAAACGDGPPLARAPEPSQPELPAVDGPRFLSRDGVGAPEDSESYYASLDVQADTAEAWMSEVFAGQPLIQGLYRNTADLGFWRELACTEEIGRGVGGCAVRNWAGPDDKETGAENLGTVAMRLDDGGRVQFYAFGPDGARSDHVILDSEGGKYLPMTCTSCHGGNANIGADGGLGSVFRELEPSQLEAPPGANRGALEETFRRFNEAIREANTSVRSDAEGAPPGSSAAAAAVVGYIDEIYARGAAMPVNDPAHAPLSWQGNSARMEVWTKVVNPYCMGCHRTSDVDLTDYAFFDTLKGDDGTGTDTSFIEQLMALDREDGSAVMPQAELSYDLLQADEAAQAALRRWLDTTTPSVGSGEVTLD